jgi:hypothetical protein
MPNKPDLFADPEGWEEHLVRRLTNAMRDNADRQQDVSEGRIRDAYADTEREIFGYGSGSEADIDHSMRDVVETHSQIEGWDGDYVSDEEQMAALTGVGTDPDYIGDRPLQHAYELEVDAENRALKEQLAASERARQAIEDRYNPDRLAERDAAQSAFYEQHGLMALEPEKAAALFGQYNQIEQRAAQLNRDRVNDSMARAHERYGRDFETTYQSLQQMDQNNPLAREIVGHVVNSPDPGQSLMELHQNDLVASLGTARYTSPPPFARTREAQRGPVRVDRTARDEDSPFNSGYGDETVEQNVFDSVFAKR